MSFILIFVLTGCTQKNATNNLKITQSDEDIIYEYLDTKTDDVAKPVTKGGKMYSAFHVFGTDNDKIYIWLSKIEYVKSNNQVINEGGAVSCPLVLNINRKDDPFSIVSHKYPEDGVNNGKSIKKLFPSDIREKMKGYKDNLNEVTKNRAEKDLLE